MYFELISIGLILAILANFFSPRDAALSFLSLVVLIFVPRLLPDPHTIGPLWFTYCAIVEGFYILAALLIRSRVSTLIAFYSIMGICSQAVGYMAYEGTSAISTIIYSHYEFAIRTWEVFQVITLICYSRPAVNLGRLAYHYLKDRIKDRGPFLLTGIGR